MLVGASSSPVITLTAAAACSRCDWTASGDWAEVDRAAEKHTKPGHPTITSARPQTSAASPAAAAPLTKE